MHLLNRLAGTSKPGGLTNALPLQVDFAETKGACQ